MVRRYAMNGNLIFAWLRDMRFAPEAAQAAEDARCFLPVEIVARVYREDERRPSNDGQIEIELPGGHRLRISGFYDPEALARLLRGLSG